MDLLAELLLLDRPYIPFTFTLGKKKLNVFIRKLSAAESDALEATYEDVWGAAVVRYTEPSTTKQNELQKVASALSRLPADNLIKRLVTTRVLDIRGMIQETMGRSLEELQAEESALRDAEGNVPEENKEAHADLIASVKVAEESAKADISAEYEVMAFEELVDRLSQAEINMRAQREGRIARNVSRLFHMLYSDEAGTKVFPSLESVRSLTEDTVAQLLAKMDLAVLEAEYASLPLDLADGQEPLEPQ